MSRKAEIGMVAAYVVAYVLTAVVVWHAAITWTAMGAAVAAVGVVMASIYTVALVVVLVHCFFMDEDDDQEAKSEEIPAPVSAFAVGVCLPYFEIDETEDSTEEA